MAKDFDQVLAEAIRDADDKDLGTITDGGGRFTETSVLRWLVQHPSAGHS